MRNRYSQMTLSIVNGHRDQRDGAARAKSPGTILEAIASGRTRIASWLLFASIALAPLPFGSSQPAAVAFWCIVLGLATVASPVNELRKQHFILLGCAAAVVAAYGFVLHEQLVSSQGTWLASANPLWGVASKALGVQLDSSASIAKHEPYFALGSPLVCILALTSSFLLSVDRARARALLWVFAVAGAAYAIYGLAEYLIDPSKILWREKTAYLESVTATFVNRNTAAVYFGSCAIVWLLLLCERICRFLPRPLPWRLVPEWLFYKTPRDIIVLFGMLFICLAAMLMTRSRAGAMLSLAALILAFITYFHRDLPRYWHMVGAISGGCAIVVILLQLMGGGITGRFDAQGLADEGRFATWRATLRLIADHPWFGTGQGTFVWSFPAYRSADVSMRGVWDHAHNTLLELAADMGIPLACLVVIGWILIFAVLIYGVRERRQDLILPVSGVAVAVLAISHSLIDFSLQIPGFSIPVFALIGAGLAQSFPGARQ